MILRLILVLTGSLLMWGCSHKDIDCPGSAVRTLDILYEWDNASGANPEGMTLYFFSTGAGSRVWRFDVSGSEGGRIELPYGGYRMVTFNNDLPGVRIEGTESFSSIDAVARKVSASASGAIGSTGMLYGSVVRDIYVSCRGVRYLDSQGQTKECGRGLIRCRPDSLAVRYTAVFENSGGLEGVRSSYVLLHGPGLSLIFSDGHSEGFGSPLYIPLVLARQAGHMEGSAAAFSPASLPDGLSGMTFVFTRNDGKSFSKEISLTPENLNIISPHNVVIHIKDFDIPDSGDNPPGDVGGIDVDVEGWQSVEIVVEPTIA